MEITASMTESRQLRIAKLRQAVTSKRSHLRGMQFAGRHLPSSRKEEFANHVRELEDEIEKLAAELHQLEVEQIRAELAGE